MLAELPSYRDSTSGIGVGSDIRRYNIEIPRRLIGANGKPSKNLDWLEKDDPRQTVQIPQSIREAGVAGNPTKALVAGAKLVDLSQYKLQYFQRSISILLQ